VICQLCSSHKFWRFCFLVWIPQIWSVWLIQLRLSCLWLNYRFGKITDFSLFNNRSFGFGFQRNFSFQFFYRVREAGILQRKLADCIQSYLVSSQIRNFLRTLSRCETLFRVTCLFEFHPCRTIGETVDISPMSRSDTRRPPSVSMSDFFADDVPWNRGKRFVAFSLSVFERCSENCVAFFFRRIFWNDRDQKFYRGVCSGKVYLKNPIYDISRIRLTSYRSTQVLIDIEIQFSIVWYAQISTSHFVAESKLFHWTNFDVFEKTSSSFCVKRKRQPRYLFFFLFEEGGSVAGQSATIRFGRGRRPRGPTYARGTIRSLFEDQEQATQRTAYDVATRPPCRNLFWGRSFRNNSVCLCRQSIHFEFIGSGFIFVYRITFSFISVSLSVSLSVFVCFFRGFFRVFIVESLCQPVLGRLESHMLAPKF
jgi:hypothetical protein